MNRDKYKDEILDMLSPRLELLGIEKKDIIINKSLFEQGILDSLSFLEFVVDIENDYNIEIDFSEMDPTQFNTIEKLIQIIENEHKDKATFQK